MKTSTTTVAVVLIGASTTLVGAAHAGFTSSGCVFSVSSSAGTGTLTNVTTDLTPTAWMSTGGWLSTGDASASVTWSNNVWGWNPSTSAGFMNANIVIRNNTSSAQDFVFTATMSGTATGPLTASGSIGGQFVNGSGTLGMLTSTGPLWGASVDGVTVNSQLSNALFFAPPFQVVSLGNFNFSNLTVSDSVDSDVAIRFSMRLSAGGEASFTSGFSFVAVPAPAALSVLALIPMVGKRRRR